MRDKTVRKSSYKGVALMKDRRHREYWVCRGNVDGFNFFSKHDTEKEAAKTYDLVLIRRGMKPVNILS